MDELHEKAISIEKEILTIRGVLDRFQDAIFDSKALIDSCTTKIQNLGAIYDYSLKKDLAQLTSVCNDLQSKYNTFHVEFTKLKTQFEEYISKVKENCETSRTFFDNKHKETATSIDKLSKDLRDLMAKGIIDLSVDLNKELGHIQKSMTKDLESIRNEVNKLSDQYDELEEKSNVNNLNFTKIFTGRQMIVGVITILCAIVGAIGTIVSILGHTAK